MSNSINKNCTRKSPSSSLKCTFSFSSYRTEAKSNCKTVFKMFFLLGMTWTLDILGWALMVYDQKNLGFKISKILIDLINSLQGVILLSVMYFNSANLKRMKRWWRKGRSESNAVSFGRQTSSGITCTKSTNLSTCRQSSKKDNTDDGTMQRML